MLLGLWQKHFSPCHSPSRPPSRRTDSLLQPASGSARSSHASEKSFRLPWAATTDWIVLVPSTAALREFQRILALPVPKYSGTSICRSFTHRAPTREGLLPAELSRPHRDVGYHLPLAAVRKTDSSLSCEFPSTVRIQSTAVSSCRPRGTPL